MAIAQWLISKSRVFPLALGERREKGGGEITAIIFGFDSTVIELLSHNPKVNGFEYTCHY